MMHKMDTKTRLRFSLILAMTLAVWGVIGGSITGVGRGGPEEQLSSKTLKLVVVLVVDQMRADYSALYGHQWTKGLRRLMDTGASFPLAAYPYALTVTCAGHATISTGNLPSTHGMVGNGWYDTSLGKSVTCTEDPTVTSVPFGGRTGNEKHSPRALLTPTLSDELRAQSGQTSTVVGLSLKPRSALTLAGHPSPTTYAIWEEDDGTWATSTAYATTAWPAVDAFATAHPISEAYGDTWNRLLPDSDYLFTDEAIGEAADALFPHVLDSKSGEADKEFSGRWERSPFSDRYLGQMAQHLVSELKLGQGGGTDMLGVSFSALDLVGHAFGPRSHEVQDTLVQLDATIGRLLDHLDAVVGPDNYVVALSADHGVAPIPEQRADTGLDAGRYLTATVRKTLETALTDLFGEGPHLATVWGTGVYMLPGVANRIRQTPGARAALTRVLTEVEGVGAAYWADELSSSAPTTDTTLQAARWSFRPERSGDMMVLPQPYWLTQATGTTHGTPHDYDQRVPVLFAGAGIRPGTYLVAASPVDIAPTLAYLAGITLAGTDGHVLTQAIR